MCKLDLPFENFKTNKRRKDGFQSQCVECQKIYRRKHYLQNRQKYIDKARAWDIEFRNWFREYKSTFQCTKCGENHPACLQFHHVENKIASVSSLVTLGNKEKVLKEIQKCIPLCANCHAKEHWKEI